MPEEEMDPRLIFDPDLVSDPGPEIFAILKLLEREHLLEVANVLIESNIRVGEARLEGYRALQKIVVQGIERGR